MPYLPDRYNPELASDLGYQETEDILFYMKAELESVYGVAYMELLEKAKRHLAWFTVLDTARKKMVEDGLLPEEDYKTWRRTQLMVGRNNYAMVQTMADDLTAVNEIAASVINGYMPEVYAINGNWIEYTISKDIKANVGFTLYDEQTVERLVRDNPDLLPKATVNIPKDLRWNKEKLNAAITQGILQGETTDDIAKRLAAVTDMNYNTAVRNAATMTTSAQNGGRMDAIHRAEDMGIQTKKKWIATLDGHTRPSHRKADGEIVATDAKFSKGLLFPGDPNGPPAEVYNCRCVLATKVDKQLDLLSDRDMRPLNRWDMTYEDWKNANGATPIVWAARNVNRDMDMWEEYKMLLGKKVPNTFTEFQRFKYENREGWRQMVSAARKARNKRRRAAS